MSLQSTDDIIIPIASEFPVVEAKQKVKRVRKTLKVAPAPIAESESIPVPIAESESIPVPIAESDDALITIKQSEWDALIARVASLEEKPKKSTKTPVARIPTKDAVLKNILNDGEIVYSRENINAGDRKGEIRILSATFSSKHNGFHINSIEDYEYDENSNEFKTPYAMSPTTLCSRFRFLMNQNGESEKNASTTCGFARCYIIRDEKEVKLNKLL